MPAAVARAAADGHRMRRRTSNDFQTADLAGICLGARLQASPSPGVTLDCWTGNSHDESGNVNEKRSVRGLRLGLRSTLT